MPHEDKRPIIVAGGNILVTDTTGIVINPINWKRDETPATISENMGSYMPDSLGNYGIVANLADARIDIKQGVLVCSSVNEIAMHELSPVFAQGIYHSFDIPFYYYNLRENAQRRVNAFFSK